MNIRLARGHEFAAIMSFYYQMTDELEETDHGPGWQKDVYPSQETVREAIENHNFFIGEIDNNIVAAMILNHEYTDGYEQAEWVIDAGPEEVLFVHALGVDFEYQGQGYAKELVDFIIGYAERLNLKAIRLDVLWSNMSAKQLYATKGFNHVDTIELYYEDTGLTQYDLYEFVLD